MAALLAAGAVRPLRALVANAGTMSGDTRRASPDGYEMTFAVNYLANAKLAILYYAMSCGVAPAPGSTCRCSNRVGCRGPRWAATPPGRFRS